MYKNAHEAIREDPSPKAKVEKQVTKKRYFLTLIGATNRLHCASTTTFVIHLIRARSGCSRYDVDVPCLLRRILLYLFCCRSQDWRLEPGYHTHRVCGKPQLSCSGGTAPRCPALNVWTGSSRKRLRSFERRRPATADLSMHWRCNGTPLVRLCASPYNKNKNEGVVTDACPYCSWFELKKIWKVFCQSQRNNDVCSAVEEVCFSTYS